MKGPNLENTILTLQLLSLVLAFQSHRKKELDFLEYLSDLCDLSHLISLFDQLLVFD